MNNCSRRLVLTSVAPFGALVLLALAGAPTAQSRALLSASETPPVTHGVNVPSGVRLAPFWRVTSSQFIGGSSGVTATIDDSDLFGISAASLGDLNGDGLPEIAIGAPADDDGGFDLGSCYVLSLNTDGTIAAETKISEGNAGFSGLSNFDFFGRAVTGMGDLDGDGIGDLAVGTYRDDDGGMDRGAVYILFLNSNGTVKSSQKISETSGGFGGTLSNIDFFGISVANLGDVDGDLVNDLAVGAQFDDGTGTDRGSVWILFLNTNGTVKSERKIGDGTGGFTGLLQDSDNFGAGIAGLGDLNGDTIPDLAVGANGDDDGGNGRGAVWICYLATDGKVTSTTKISDTTGGFTGQLGDSDNFGTTLSFLGDVDGDGLGELAVGAWRDDDGGPDRGAIWILAMEADGSVAFHRKISDARGGFKAGLNDGDGFGISIVAVEQNEPRLVSGVFAADDGGLDRGGAYVMEIDTAPSVVLGGDPLAAPLSSAATAFGPGLVRVVPPTGARFAAIWLGTALPEPSANLQLTPVGAPLLAAVHGRPITWDLPTGLFVNGLSAQALFLFEETSQWSEPFTLR